MENCARCKESLGEEWSSCSHCKARYCRNCLVSTFVRASLGSEGGCFCSVCKRTFRWHPYRPDDPIDWDK